jgi:hypothetical protein
LYSRNSYLQLITALALIHTLYNSLQHALSLLSLRCLHRLSPGNTPNAVDSSASLFQGSGPRWLASISQLDSALLWNGLQQWGLLRVRKWATVCDELRRWSVSQLLPVDSRLVCLFRWSSWYSYGTGHTENTAPNSSSVVAWRQCCRGEVLIALSPSNGWHLVTLRCEAWRVPLLRASAATVTWRPLSHCLAADIFTQPFPSDDRLFWLHNSGSQQICDNTIVQCNNFRKSSSYIPDDSPVWTKLHVEFTRKHGLSADSTKDLWSCIEKCIVYVYMCFCFTVKARIFVKYRIYASNINFNQQCW